MNLENWKPGDPVPVPPQPKSEAEIMASWKGDIDTPLVSISCTTYNHEPYIKDALNGFLMQETDFPFEVLIHDDASTDKTADIIRDYEARYPKIIKPIYQTENQYSRGIIISSNYQYPRAKGKYIALCEGDDYWIDALKLQKQVDFMEANIDFGLIHSKHKTLNQKKKVFYESCKSEKNSFYDLLKSNNISTLTVLLRKRLLFEYFIDVEPRSKNWKMGDYPIWLWFSLNSKIKLLNEVTSVYRITKGSMSHSGKIDGCINFLQSAIDIRNYFMDKYTVSDVCRREINENNANIKIKRGVRIGSLELYNSGVNDKRALGYKVQFIQILYGQILKRAVLRKIFQFYFSFLKSSY